MSRIVLRNATIVNEGKKYVSDLSIEKGIIERIAPIITLPASKEINLEGNLLLPGCIDDQVHFREPGLVAKGDIYTESRAAVAGGITSYMEMPNTVPNTLSQSLLAEKYALASQKSLANYSFYMGASNDNLEEVLKTDPNRVCGIKIFMGSYTGNMLVDRHSVLEKIFSSASALIATHCEDEQTILQNTKNAVERFGENIPLSMHPLIRDVEACYLSSSFAVSLAKKTGARLHVLHISSAKETALFDNTLPLEQKKITAEACVHHLWFSDENYAEKGSFIKWNPAIKTVSDREALWRAVLDNRIDVIATDHAPHTLEEKRQPYLKCPSGGPLVQHALLAMLEKVTSNTIDITRVVEKMAHAPAVLFRVENRGFIREGYQADLVEIDTLGTLVDRASLHYKCGWSPFEGYTFKHRIKRTFVNGNLAFQNGAFCTEIPGERLLFKA
ncbi:MAG: dihydroorotase [Flavobacteriales bacterium]